MFDEGRDDRGDDANQFTEAFSKATGYTQGGMTLYMIWKAPLDRYAQKPGASEAEVREIFDRLMRETKWKDDDGAVDAGPQGRVKDAPSSSPVASGKAGPDLSKGLRTSASPTRGPTRAQIAAAATVAKEIALTVLDTFKIRDGRSIGDVRFGEIGGLTMTNAVEAAVLRQCKLHARADDSAKIRDVIGKKQIEQFIANAERQARQFQENGNV